MLVAVLLLRPGSGWLWRAVRALRADERVQIEDALKHLFDSEYHGRAATLQSVSGALGVPGHRAAALLARLEGQGLARSADGGYRLTVEGRSDALRVVRIHRLWERYLAEKTGLAPADWHEKAERLEHATSAEETEALSAALGHPRYDPHGDPIPTPGGEIAPLRGRPLPSLPVGELAEIVHVEDEPEAIFAQLVAEGLHPGMRVRLEEVTPERIRLVADAEEHVLAPVVAANVSVLPLARDERMVAPGARLSDLAMGESARVIALSPALRGPERRRLLDLGLVPGTRVEAELRSPSGDPTGYLVRGAVIALRREQADKVHVERGGDAAAGGAA
ncbi:MAG: iron dependent repressor, metal binding and dimerization domain protein [Thermoanaerobaculia bacterium]